MKASETGERYIGKVRECCNYAVRSAKTFVVNSDSGHRQPGGNGTDQLRAILTGDLDNFSDEIIEQTFSADQKAYVVSNLITFAFLLAATALAVLAYFYSPWIVIAALVCSFLALLAFFGVFGSTSKDIDNTNVLAKRYSAGDPEKRVILTANLDAPYKRKLSRKTELILKILVFLGILLNLGFDILVVLVNSGTTEFFGSQYIMYFSFVLIPFILLPLFLSRTVATGASFPGVSDNLIGCYTACGALRYLATMDLRLKETEVCVLLTDSKANKSKGAKEFCRSFAGDLNSLDTTVVCLDSIYDPDSLNVTTKGKGLSKLMTEAAMNAEVLVTDQNPKYIVSDAKAFQKAKVNTVLINTLPDEMPEFYRGPEDTEVNLNVRAVEAAIKLSLELIYAIDES